MRRWRNGGIRGRRISRTAGARQLSLSMSPRDNGGVLGNDRIDSNLDNNVAKTSGIWNIDGLVLTDHDVTTVETIDNSYWEYPASYEAFQETSRTYLGGGYTWNVAAVANACGLPTWPQGPYGGHSGSNLSRQWTDTSYDAATCDGWTFDVYRRNGYYYTVYPDPIYHEDITYNNVTTTYRVWNYF